MRQEDLAREVGVSVVNISRWENGARGVSGTNLFRLANALGVTRSWLMEEAYPHNAAPPIHIHAGPVAGGVASAPSRRPRPKPITHSSASDSVTSRAYSNDEADGDDWIELPSVEAAAGLSGITPDPEPCYLRFKRSFLQGFGHAAMLGVSFAAGDSMLPSISNGDMTVVKLGRDEWRRGGIMLVRMEDGLLLKRVQVMADGHMKILSDNPLFPPIEVASGDDVSVIGRVVWVGRRM